MDVETDSVTRALHIVSDDLGEGDVLTNRLNLHVHGLTGVATVDDDDVATLDLRDPITLLAERLDRC